MDTFDNEKLGYIFITIIIGIIGFFGMTLNSYVIFIIVKYKNQLWTPINVVLLNLVVGDFIVSIVGSPMVFLSALYGQWYWNKQACIWAILYNKRLHCKHHYLRYAWLMSCLGLASIGNLTVMAVERWLLVVKPFRAIDIRSAYCLATLVWIYSIGLTFPPLFGWGSYGLESVNVSCSVSWEVHDLETHSDSYIAFLFFFGMILPVTIICTCYIDIIVTLKKVKKQARSRSRRERRVTKMVALMIIAFLLAWTPYASFALASQYLNYRSKTMISILPSLLAKTSVCYNPIIYAFLNNQFPNILTKLCRCKPIDEQNTSRIVTNPGISLSHRG